MFSIGEFSKISGFSVKALRLYHENGLLVPKIVDSDSGYRYYDFDNVEQARVVAHLRQMMFSLEQIKEIMRDNNAEQSDVLRFLESHRSELNAKLREMKKAAASLEGLIKAEREAQSLFATAPAVVEEMDLPAQTIAGIRMKGKYSDCGAAFGKLGRSLGGLIAGKPFTLYYDGEYKEADADFECCFPVKRTKAIAAVSFRELPGGRSVTLAHKGQYDHLGRSYARLFSYLNERGLKIGNPTREVYLKGPGMIFRGNPRNYLTQIQAMLI